MPTPNFVNPPPLPTTFPLSVDPKLATPSTCTLLTPAPKSIPLRKSIACVAVPAFNTKADGANAPTPHTTPAGLPKLPNATCTFPPFALNPLTPPVICMFPAPLPPTRARFAPVSITPPPKVNKLPTLSPTPSFARIPPPITRISPLYPPFA